MRLDNQTPLEAVAFRQFASDGSLDRVVSVRGSFFHQQDAELGLAQEQVPFQFQDIYQGDPDKLDLLLPSDLVPEKPGTDVSFLGSSFAPDGEAASRWTCGIRVGDRLHKRLLVSAATGSVGAWCLVGNDFTIVAYRGRASEEICEECSSERGLVCHIAAQPDRGRQATPSSASTVVATEQDYRSPWPTEPTT